METKDMLLTLLLSHKGDYLSGEEIAQTLTISRTAVWKAANALRSAGYHIDAVRNRGYCLAEDDDILSVSGIEALLGAARRSLTLELVASTESTNSLLRERANANCAEGYVVLAGHQTKGRGRLGRSFYSPPDTGLYLSLLLRPTHLLPGEAARITTMAAVAACRAIEEVSGQEAKIKWVNDIYLDGKKVCGILTEASLSLESGSLEYAVVGVGFNVNLPEGGFPEALSEIAGAIFPQKQDQQRNRLAAAFLRHFLAIYHNGDITAYSDEYRRRSFVLGHPIFVHSPSGVRSAWALDVDSSCRLVVRYDDGTIASLSSAEISIRPAEGGL